MRFWKTSDDRGLRGIPSQLCPAHIQSAGALENWLIPIRIEAQRQEAQSVLGNSELHLFKGMLNAASRQIQALMRR